MARFCREINRETIILLEFEDPFEEIKLFDLTGVHARPLTLTDVPEEYRPYKGCLFDVLSHPDTETRLENLKEFFQNLAIPGDPGRTCGLMYTVMHIWRHMYFIAMLNPAPREVYDTLNFFVEGGMVESFMRILHFCHDKQFILCEYNRYVPYRILEIFFVATQADFEVNEITIDKMLKDEEKATKILLPIITGVISWVEQIAAAQLFGNLSCFPKGVLWLLNNPPCVGAMGTFLWKTFVYLYLNYRQYEDRKTLYQKALITSNITVVEGKQKYEPSPPRIGDLTTFVTLCALCNVCAAHPEEKMERIEPCLLAVAQEGLYWNLGTICCGILLSESQYNDLTLEKLLSFLSWSCFNKGSQKLIMEQIRTLPYGRLDEPLHFRRNAYTLSRGIVACLISHALWLDYEKGAHFAILGLVSLLTENDDIAVKIIELIGDQLLDLAHSIHHVKMPGDGDPLSVKRAVFETFLRLGGWVYYDEKGRKSKPITKRFQSLPACVLECRKFSERFTLEMMQTEIQRRTNIRRADAFKTEGNAFFIKGQYEAAIECYDTALKTCPLSCTERRVTYHSNRAECYLKTHQPRKAIRDCNRALAMNPHNMKARWRRAQALQILKMNYPAALDLWTIKVKVEEAKKILGEEVFAQLDQLVYNLLDKSTFLSLTEEKYGCMVFTGSIKRQSGMNKDTVKDKTSVPPFRGQTYQELFGVSKPEYF